MKFTRHFAVAAFALCASSAFAGNTVETFGRGSALPQEGSRVTAIAAGCASCHVANVQGRATLNAVHARRQASGDVVTVRNASVESVYGRA
jgi:hypothetical protein